LSPIRHEKSFRDLTASPTNAQLYADAFENAPHAMAIIGPDGSIGEANRAFCGMLGYSRWELRRLRVSDITHAEDFITELEQRHRLECADIGRYELVQRYIRKDRAIVWGRLSVSATRRQRGEPPHFVAQIEAVSASRSPDAAEAFNARLSRINDATLSAMHEIGNCLTPLMLNTEMIVEQSPRGDVFELAQQIFKAARRIAFTLRRLRPIDDVQPVAYLGQNRLLDLRLVAPPAEES
jgi:PAS domain S-box-containing protein